MGEIAIVLALGLAAGILGGFIGVGGGVLIVPVLVLALGFDQHLAVGTSLGALLPPVGILGAYEYYKHGHLNVTYALLLGLGLLIGALHRRDLRRQDARRRLFVAFSACSCC